MRSIGLLIRCAVILAAVCYGVSSPAASVVLDDTTVRRNLGPHVSYLEDKTHAITVEDLISGKGTFTANRSESLNFGFTDSAYWFKVDLLYDSGKNHRRDWFLEFDYPLLDHVEVYDFSAEKGYRVSRGGDMRPFSERIIRHRNFIFPIETERGKMKSLFIKITSTSSLKANLGLVERQHFLVRDQDITFLYGIYYGVLLIMILYNFFIFLTVGDRAYLFYVLYVSCFILMRMSMDGFAAQYLWSENVWWTNISVTFLSAFTTF